MTTSARVEQTIKNAYAMPKKSGRAEYIKHLEGDRLTRDAAIRAKCFQCVCGEDSELCIIPQCPLTPFCQWNKRGE